MGCELSNEKKGKRECKSGSVLQKRGGLFRQSAVCAIMLSGTSAFTLVVVIVSAVIVAVCGSSSSEPGSGNQGRSPPPFVVGQAVR